MATLVKPLSMLAMETPASMVQHARFWRLADLCEIAIFQMTSCNFLSANWDDFFLLRCLCPPGFSGFRCEANLDECDGHKCLNNATCIDGIGSYSCACPRFIEVLVLNQFYCFPYFKYNLIKLLSRGFNGQFCETKVQFCSPEFNPCVNGGKCIDHFYHYTCECVAGFTGENCTKNINDCADHMCQVK